MFKYMSIFNIIATITNLLPCFIPCLGLFAAANGVEVLLPSPDSVGESEMSFYGENVTNRFS